MSPGPDTVAALAVTLWPAQAERLLSRAGPATTEEGRRLAALEPGARLAELARALQPTAAPDEASAPPWLRDGRGRLRRAGSLRSPLLRRLALEWTLAGPSAARTGDRETDGGDDSDGRGSRDGVEARNLDHPRAMFPFDVMSLSPGVAELNLAAADLGAQVAGAAATAIGSFLEADVRIAGRILPAVPEAGAVEAVAIELAGIGEHAVLAVDCALAARVAAGVGGGSFPATPATVLAPTERAILDLVVLGVLEAVALVPAVDEALSPRMGMRPRRVSRPVAVEISVQVGDVRGRALLLLPARALRALRPAASLPERLEGLSVPVSVRSGSSSVPADRVASARPGDVVPLDVAPGGRATATWPGGARVRGRLGADSLTVDEVDMAEVTGTAAALPVQLEVDLGPVPVPLRDLARLEPGAVLPLGLDPRGRVALRLGDRILARGDLVDLDGGVGVRIAAVEEAP